MHAYGEAKLDKYRLDDIWEYLIFDEDGILAGIKDDAPQDLKEAYEENKKIQAEWAAEGID